MTSRFLACAVVLLLPLPAAAQTSNPSFDCRRAATATEHAICRSDRLADLDVQMVALYNRASRTSDDRALRRLRSHQAIWRDWRNTCGGDADCLSRRYVDRIIDFDPSRATALTPIDPDAPVERRLREGRYETVWPDGRITFVNVDGGGGGTFFPDGTGSVHSFVQILPDDFPTLPGTANPWVEQVELGLIAVVKGMLPPENHGDYDALQAGLPLDTRVFRHIEAIGFLSDD